MLLTAAAGAMGCLLALLPAAGHDQMWLLYAANLVRHGVKLYGPELFESNPPLIVWLSVIPSASADWFHVPSTAVGKLLVCGLGVAVAVECTRLLRGMGFRARPLMWGLAFVYTTAFAVVPARDFGQRDHLLAFLCLPYLICAARAMTGHRLSGWQAWLAGLAAGVGIALKPHQLVVVLAAEAAVAVARRRAGALVRPEVVAIVSAGLAYLAAIWVFCPEYLTRMLPVLGETYWAMGHLTWLQLMSQAVQLHVLALVVIGAALLARPMSPVVTVFLIAGAAATVGYYFQRTGWYYQQLPAITFFTFALAIVVIEAAGRRTVPMPRWTPAAGAGLSVLAVGLTAYAMGFPFTLDRSFSIDTPDPSFFAGLPEGTSVTTLTTTVDYTIPPVFKYHLTLAQRYPHLWMLPAILRSESGEHVLPSSELARLEQLQHQSMIADFLRWQPQLVLVERCQDATVHCQVLEDRHDDLLAWFLRDERFRDEFSRYKYLRSIGRFDAYVPK